MPRDFVDSRSKQEEREKNIVASYFVEFSVRRIHFSGKSILPAGFVSQGVLNKDPAVWLDGARPLPIKSIYEFGKIIIRRTLNLWKIWSSLRLTLMEWFHFSGKSILPASFAS